MPLLSIVLTTYKDLAYFLEINQNFISTIKELDNIELSIVDDSSTYQEAWLGANQFLDNELNNIILLCTLKNLKQGGARNLAIPNPIPSAIIAIIIVVSVIVCFKNYI
jgi:glycosyltransferase involved in cell wall biosynthesis